MHAIDSTHHANPTINKRANWSALALDIIIQVALGNRHGNDAESIVYRDNIIEDAYDAWAVDGFDEQLALAHKGLQVHFVQVYDLDGNALGSMAIVALVDFSKFALAKGLLEIDGIAVQKGLESLAFRFGIDVFF